MAWLEVTQGRRYRCKDDCLASTDIHCSQVCVRLPTSAVNVTLLAYAAERRVVAPLLLTAGRAIIDRYLLPAGRKAANLQQRSVATGRVNDGTYRQTDARPLHRPCTAYYADNVNNMMGGRTDGQRRVGLALNFNE